jgi:hypothetical protein
MEMLPPCAPSASGAAHTYVACPWLVLVEQGWMDKCKASRIYRKATPKKSTARPRKPTPKKSTVPKTTPAPTAPLTREGPTRPRKERGRGTLKLWVSEPKKARIAQRRHLLGGENHLKNSPKSKNAKKKRELVVSRFTLLGHLSPHAGKTGPFLLHGGQSTCKGVSPPEGCPFGRLSALLGVGVRSGGRVRKLDGELGSGPRLCESMRRADL